jgi:hypothetical protein
MTTIKDLTTQLRHNLPAAATTIDLEKSFFQILLPPKWRNLFGYICIDENRKLQGFRMTRLPMGFTASVNIMHRVTELLHVITIAHMPIPPPHRIVHDVYVDNILVAASFEYCTDYLATLQKIAHAADISLGEIAQPHQVVSHRGMLLDLTTHKIQLKPSKLPEIQRKIYYAQHHPITLTMANTWSDFSPTSTNHSTRMGRSRPRRWPRS